MYNKDIVNDRGKGNVNDIDRERDSYRDKGIYRDRDIDITRSIKIIEWLKSELLTDIASLFKVLLNATKDNTREIIIETVSNIIIVAYLIGRRFGVEFEVIDIKIENKLKLGIIEEHDLEKLYGDLSGLTKHINSGRRKSNKGD